MRLSVIITLTLLFGCMMAAEQDQEASYKIDDALDALIDLREDTANSLYELEEVWRMSKEALQGEERALIELISTREAQCKVDLENRDKTEKDLKDTNDYIEWLEKQIKDSSENLEELLIRRCELNKQFIDHIKREKIAMSLLEFIRIAVERKETFDFLQMKKFNKSFAGFLQAYHNNDMNTLMLLQQDLVDGSQYNVDVDFSTHDRTEEETGTGHVDNEKGNISLDDFTNGRRKNWSIYKQELLDILVELKAKISQKIKAAIDDEIAASVALANYKNNVLRNIEKYEKELVKARKQAIDLQDQLNDDNATLQKCQSDHAELQIQLQQIQNEIAHKQSEFDIKHHDLGEQVAIFDEIIAEYRNSVFSENNEFKDRTEDYFDNETFDNDDSYTNREIPDIDFINGGF